MSQRPPPFGQQPNQSEEGIQYQQGPSQSPAQQRARDLYSRDPDTGRFLTDQEAAYVAQLARQYPQEVHRAYAQNVSFAAVGLPVPPNLGDLGSQIPPEPQQPQQSRQFSQQPQQSQQFTQQSPEMGYQQQPAPVSQQPVQGGQYQQPQQMAPGPQRSQVGGNQEPGGPPQQHRQPPQQQFVERSGGQIGGQTEQAMGTQSQGGQPVQRPPTEQPQQGSGQQPGRSREQSQDRHSAGEVRIPVERTDSGQAARVPLHRGYQQSRQRRYRQRRRHPSWFWWYNW